MKRLHLNLIYLKYFCDAVRSGSISAAARLNHVTQSAVSQGIHKLEKRLDSTLISHQPNRFKVTDEGKRLFSNARHIFRAIETTEDFLNQDAGRVCFGCTHSFALSSLPDCLKLVRKELPNLKINVRLGHTFNIKAWLRDGTIDFGILLDNDDLSAFEQYPLHQGWFGLYVSKQVRGKTLASLPFLVDSEERVETNLLKAAYRAKKGKELPILMEISSWSVIANLVKEGFGVGLFPDYIASGYQEVKPIFDEFKSMKYTLFALFEKNTTPSTHAARLVDLLKSQFNNLSDR